jgi:outer membrane lipoprotein SlyB
MNKLFVAGILILFVTGANAETVTDHYKRIIEQKPYRVEVCKDVNIPESNAGEGALGGMIIGGVLGKVLGGDDKGAAAGAVIGGVIGADQAQNKPSGIQRQCQIETRYKELQREVYSHSVVTFMYNGKQQKLQFSK